jgi:LysM repeat protein
MGLQTRFTRPLGLLISSVAALALAAACYQPAGSGLEATSVAFAAATATPIPSETPFPSETPVPTDTPTEEPTLDVEAQSADLFTSTPFALVAFTNTPDPIGQAGTEIAMAQVNDPLLLTATALAQQLNGGQIIDPLALTSTAIAIQQGQPPIDPMFLTATQIIANATGTAGAPMTQTMEALLGPSGTPTLPPGIIATATFTPAVIAPTVPPTGTCTHTVSAGENLFRISLQYNTTVNAIAQANGIVNPNLILVGQVLTIPGCGSGGGGTGQPQPQPPPNFNCTGQTYTVQQGETLFEISLRFNVPVLTIQQCNPAITNINLIFINQQIVIPTATG